jgi:hypothetical protein
MNGNRCARRLTIGKMKYAKKIDAIKMTTTSWIRAKKLALPYTKSPISASTARICSVVSRFERPGPLEVIGSPFPQMRRPSAEIRVQALQ